MTRIPTACLALALIGGCNDPDGSPAAAGTQSPQGSAPAAVDNAVGSGQTPPSPQAGGGPEPVAHQDPADDARYAGRWIGVEGMFFNVTPLGSGRYRIEMQHDLDHRVEVVGYSTGDGLAFTRGGQLLVARRTNGDATGLKYLAGKTDCLTVKPGEGYCRA